MAQCTAVEGGLRRGRRVVGAGLLALGAGAALLLALDHLGGIALPGCGRGGGCARAAASAFGSVPVVGWPVSFAGLAWSAALLAGWILAQGGVPRAYRIAARAGAAISVVFLGAMAVGGYPCAYCALVHVASLAFWIVAERTPTAAGLRPLAGAAAAFVSVTAVLWTAERALAERQRSVQEAELARSTERVLAAPDESALFTGRYRIGPERARARIVVFSDYQCPDCKRIEEQARALVAAHDDVSVSMKHFPMSAACNPAFAGNDLHPNACWAARAAEAAGILWGRAGFRALHEWLFDRGGVFTPQDLERFARERGADPAEFRRTLEGAETLARVGADIEEGNRLGLHFTPMVFVNGVELRGVFAEGALVRAVDAVLAARPEAAGAEADRPAAALEKIVADWREGPRVALPADAHAWPLGADGARLAIEVWGDYRDPTTREADAAIRAWLAVHDGARYAFRHFPFDRGCNALVPRTGHPGACAAAQLAEAAGRLGGEVAFWRVHAWLFEHGDEELGAASVARAGEAAGLGAAELARGLDDPGIRAVIDEDVRAGAALLYRGGIPTIYVAGRVVPRWRSGGESVLARILDAAAAE